jgi:hypothetical protein
MKIINEVDVQPTGSLTFENNASLVQVPVLLCVGNMDIHKNNPPIKDTDYVYWSSPVAGAKLAAIKRLLYTIRLTLQQIHG